MALCALCRAINFDELPPMPFAIFGIMSGYPDIQQFIHWREEDKGVAHHQSLDSLAKSATNLQCGLCNLILEQVLQCERQLEELKPSWEANERPEYAWPLWEFWLVRRPHGGNGFWVMTFTDGSVLRGEARLVAAIGFCVKDGDPLAGVIRGHTVEQQRGTPTAIKRVRNWLAECDTHSQCRSTEAFLPSRVIDVGSKVGSPHVRLYETRDHGAERYIALSYCWGEVPQFTTTASTLEDRKRCITVSHLPKTHQDAIRLTQELGVRYLWIDSICIIQGDREDWELESANMLSVYANSYLTIAASNGKDSHQGLFSDISPRKYCQIDSTFRGLKGQFLAFNCPLQEEAFSVIPHDETRPHLSPISLDYMTLPREPLSKRGWTLQERLLSQRTIHYTTQQMFFECKEGYRSEDGLLLHVRFGNIQKMMNGTDQDGQCADIAGTDGKGKALRYKEELMEEWYRLLWLYGRRELSILSDKLPTISGLAGMFAKRLNDHYVAGLWRSDLFVGLTWQALRCRRVKEYRAPSWSWASVEGDFGVGTRFDSDELARILDVQIKLKGANPYGEVLEGRIKICAPMRRLRLAEGNKELTRSIRRHQAGLEIRMENIRDEDIVAIFDYDWYADDWVQEAARIFAQLQETEAFALILIATRKSIKDYYPVRGLIVAKVPGSEEFERFGTISLPCQALDQYREEDGEGSARQITLI